MLHFLTIFRKGVSSLYLSPFFFLRSFIGIIKIDNLLCQIIVTFMALSPLSQFRVFNYTLDITFLYILQRHCSDSNIQPHLQISYYFLILGYTVFVRVPYYFVSCQRSVRNLLYDFFTVLQKLIHCNTSQHLLHGSSLKFTGTQQNE